MMCCIVGHTANEELLHWPSGVLCHEHHYCFHLFSASAYQSTNRVIVHAAADNVDLEGDLQHSATTEYRPAACWQTNLLCQIASCLQDRFMAESILLWHNSCKGFGSVQRPQRLRVQLEGSGQASSVISAEPEHLPQQKYLLRPARSDAVR